MKIIQGLALAPLALTCLLAAPAPALAQAEKTVLILRELDTDKYDPHRTTARGAAEVLFMAADTMVGLDYDMKTPVPALAKSWTISPDGLTYTFNLRDDVTFCSGRKMTAKDVVASYTRWLDPETKGLERWRAGPVDSITAPDDVTVVYKLKKPYNELLQQMAHYMHSVINIDQVKALGQDYGVKAFDGTGPYCFQSWSPRNEVVLTRHAGYKWGPAIYKDPTPKVDKIVWKIVPEESTRLTALQSGQADLSRYLPQWSIKDLKADKRLFVSKADPFYWTFFLGFKIDKPMLTDVNVRRALNLAINRKALTEAITFGEAVPATSMRMPSGEVQPGALRAMAMLVEYGSCGASQGASSATSTMAITASSDSSRIGSRRRRDAMRASGVAMAWGGSPPNEEVVPALMICCLADPGSRRADPRSG